jgi:hypothetical protein
MATHDPLDDYMTTCAELLRLPLDPAWRPAVRLHLDITLRLAALLEEIPLPDEAEPAPVFRA